MDLIDIYRTFHPKTTEYTFFSSAHRTFSRIDHFLGHKTNLNKFRSTEIIQASSLTTWHQTRNQPQEKKREKTITWRLNNMLLKNQWVYYLAIKRSKIELFVVRWMDLESVIQSEVSQKEKNKYRMLTHIYGILKNCTDELVYKAEIETQM